MTRVALLNVKYSPNLGDGLLCECLERELAAYLGPSAEVMSIDLAGRQGYAVTAGTHRAKVMSFLEMLPGRLRTIVAGGILKILVAVRLRKHYRQHLSEATVAVVGGGNLFSDVDLNFPIKIAGALKEAALLEVPVAVHAVGVTPKWSAQGLGIFRQSLARARALSISVRDPQSREAWSRHFEGTPLCDAAVVVDPGVLASLHFRVAARATAEHLVGFCITDPLAIRYHSSPAASEGLDAWYPSAIRSLVLQGFQVILFTNGSPEDRDYLDKRAEGWLRHAKGPVTIAPSFNTPADLAALVAACTAVVAHRMHACIAAYSFGVPAIGLRWDVKLESFFALSGRGPHLVDAATVGPEDLGARVTAAISEGVDPATLIEKARSEIRDLAHVIQGAVAPKAKVSSSALAPLADPQTRHA